MVHVVSVGNTQLCHCYMKDQCKEWIDSCVLTKLYLQKWRSGQICPITLAAVLRMGPREVIMKARRHLFGGLFLFLVNNERDDECMFPYLLMHL